MPIELEAIQAPSEQDLLDLAKIYQDRPEWMPLLNLQEWLKSPAQTLYAGHFNGRLLAAITVRQQPAGSHLEHLCVRGLTRRRGVALRLLEMILALDTQASYTLHCGPEDTVAEQLIAKLPPQQQTRLTIMP